MTITKKYIINIITLIVALQLLNLSIYAQDFKPLLINQETTETNISETITEFISEVILGYTNSFPEQSQHHKDLHFHKHISFKAIAPLAPSVIFEITYPVSNRRTSLQEHFSSLFNQEINPPPPKNLKLKANPFVFNIS